MPSTPKKSPAAKKKLKSLQRQLAMDDGRRDSDDSDAEITEALQPSYWSRISTSPTGRGRNRRSTQRLVDVTVKQEQEVAVNYKEKSDTETDEEMERNRTPRLTATVRNSVGSIKMRKSKVSPRASGTPSQPKDEGDAPGL